MNLKDRGITVGDLLIITLIIIISLFIIKNFNNDKQTSFNLLQSNVLNISQK